jgi:DNA helicase-2/ATP-dependent DNA helicase PcrA
MRNKLYIAGAGAGKTTLLVKEALSCSDSVLLTTFTVENEEEIKKKFYELNSFIPKNITIKTWFSFLIEHGAKPYQGVFTEKKINGLLLVNNKSGFRGRINNRPVYYGEDNVDRHYFSQDYRIYSDKLSKFVVRCNESTDGKVLLRISDLFKNIFIDEVQDMAGYDLEFIKLLLRTKSKIVMVGDSRQVTYYTHFSAKYKKYKDGEIKKFVKHECGKNSCFIDTITLGSSFRCNQSICDFANTIFPEKSNVDSLNHRVTGHDGVFLVKKSDVEDYLKKYKPMQLRYNKKTVVKSYCSVKNYGEAKGRTYDRVLIYPTKTISDWLFKNKEISSNETKCKFYVAVTRARNSVAIVCEDSVQTRILPFYVT